METDPRAQRTLYFACAAALFFLLIGIYLLTYRGFPLSQDEFFIYDITESLTRRGNFYRTYEFSRFNTWEFGPQGEPWGQPNQEPLISILLVPFFWLGQALPGVGIMHVAWLFNILVTALTAASIFAGALLLRYPLQTAWLAGLIFGVATLAWPYSRHLFREPLMAFFAWWCFVLAILIQQSWRQGRIPWRLGGLLAAAFTGAFLTKAISIVLIPGLLIVLLPPMRRIIQQRRLLFALGVIGLALVAAVLVIVGLDDARLRYSPAHWVVLFGETDWTFLWESFLGYHFSPGRSLWLHSPVLLAGLVGAWLLLKEGNWRLVTGVAVVLVIMSAAYGIAHTTSWWGSWGWGPRYMLPLVPVLMLWVLPVMPRLRTVFWRFVFLVLVILGIGLQLIGIAVRLPNYYTDLNRAGILTDWATQPQWAVYNWTWEWSPIRYHLERLDLRYLDIAWLHANPGWLVPLLALALVVASIAFGFRLFRYLNLNRRGAIYCAPTNPSNTVDVSQTISSRSFYGYVSGLTLLTIIAVAAGIFSLRADDRYIEEWPDVLELAQELDQQARPDQVIFVDREQYMLIFMNYFKSPALVATLPYSPGESYGPEGPEVISDDPVELMGFLTFYTLQWINEHYEQAWLVASSSPFEADKIRPVERFLAGHYFPIQEITISPRARAIRFLVDNAPLGEPAETTDYVFDDQLALEGFDLPTGTAFNPGDVVPLSLSWLPLEALPDDYNVSVQIVTLDGLIVAQRDGQPQGTFGFMSRWEAGQRQRDHHGIQLPPDIPPGIYAVQVVVYRWQDGERLRYDDGQAAGDVARLTEIEIGE